MEERQEEKKAITFIWKADNNSEKIKSVDLIIAEAGSVNNDPFADYLDGTAVKDCYGSPLEVYELNASATPGSYEKIVTLKKLTYQFVFRITNDDGDCRISVSRGHLQTVLATGRAVNYVELEGMTTGTNQGKDDFADISEATPLLKAEQKRSKEERTQSNGKGCGCGPDKCCII
eukprot:gene3574-4078_t